jgi:hypothetical protein
MSSENVDAAPDSQSIHNSKISLKKMIPDNLGRSQARSGSNAVEALITKGILNKTPGHYGKKGVQYCGGRNIEAHEFIRTFIETNGDAALFLPHKNVGLEIIIESTKSIQGKDSDYKIRN